MTTYQARQKTMLHTAFGNTINALLNDEKIIEIMLNPDGKLWAESITEGKFFTQHHIPATQANNIIKLLASSQQLLVDKEHPELSCEIPDSKARFQAWLPPVVSAPSFTIRKLATQTFSLKDYVKNKALSLKQSQQLSEALEKKYNILIAGGTGSGKTTFTNSLLHELKNQNDRIIVLEDLPELQLSTKDYIKLQTTKDIGMRQLVKSSLRMRPDRIIIGEVRDSAALEMLKAWNTGHPGGICTIHANSAQAALGRLEDLIREAIPAVPIRLIEEAIDMIVFMQRNKSGQHSVAEVITLKS